MNASTFGRRCSLFFAALTLTPLLASGAPVSMDFKVLIDADNRETTGCTVVTTSGLVKGVDQVLTTSVSYDTVANTAAVTGVTRQTCTDSVQNTFSSALPVDSTGWPVGVAGGNLLIETHMPRTALGGVTNMHLAFTAVSGALVDSVILDNDGTTIIWPPLPGVRRRVANLATTRVITLDGADGDWANIANIAEGTASGSPALRFLSVRTYMSDTDLYFALSVQSNAKAPTANDDTYTVERGQSLGVGVPGVLSNDTDPNNKPLTAILIPASGTHHGALVLNADGSFSYVNDGSPAPSDSFEYKANNGSADSNTAQVTITITEPNAGPPPVLPKFTSANSTRFTVGTFGSFTITTTPVNPAVTVSKHSGALPSGVTFSAIAGSGTGKISGTPAPGTGGVYPLVLRATNAVGSVDQSFTLIVCNIINVGNPATATATANTPFSQSFTQTGAVGTATFSTASTLPAGLTLASNGVLSGTPTVTGTFPISVTVTDANGCSGTGAAYNLVIGCQTITVTNPATTTGTANTAFSQTFTASNTIGPVTFSTASTLPAGLSLSGAGVLSGTPTQTGSFPIVVKATDGNGCQGTGATYTLTIACQTITVTNPATTSGTVNVPFSQSFTAGNTIGATTFTTASALPAGLSLSSAGVLSGTPTQTGSFPIVVHVVDANGCSANGPTYTLTIACQVITVNNPSTTSGTVNVAFSQSFTASNTIGATTFSTASALPTGLTLSSAGVLSGTPTQSGSFPIVVTATDANGCSGSGATYTLVIACQVITVTNPATNTGTVNVAFSQSFSASNTVGAVTFSTASTLPAGLTLSSAGVLSGTPTQSGSFPIVVTATDANGCSGNGATYNLTIACQTITVTNPVTNTGTVNAVFSQVFTAGNTIGTVTFTTASALPAGLTLATNGTLSGIPTQTGTFPIVVTATDANGCSGNGATYSLTIGCQTITVTNPANTAGTANAAFSEQFTAGNTVGTVTFTTASALPTGLTLSTSGLLSGTPTQTGSFPIVVTATDANGCSGSGATYTLVIACQTISVTNPANSTGTVSSPFSEQFTQSGAIGTATFTTASSLPSGLTLSSSGLLSGTPLVTGSFPIVVTVTDSNGCTGSGATYTLVINCQTITVTNPANASGTANAAFSEQFTQSGAIGGATFTTASALPTGLSLSAAGLLSGTPTQTGSFPIVVTVTDGNGCTGTGATYTLVINCQSISVGNPSSNSATAGSALVAANFTFTQSGSIGGATFTTSSALPAGVSLTSAGVLTGTPTQTGSFPITVTVTDGNGCTGTSSGYTLTINCQTITVTNPSSNSAPAGSPLVAANFTFTQSNAIGGATFTTSSTLPAGVSLTSAGVLTGTPTQTGPFPITVTVTDGNSCTGTSVGYTLTITCQTITVTNPSSNSAVAGSALVAANFTFTQSNAIGGATFTTSSTLPTGVTLSAAGVLTGTPTQTGSFPITVTVTDGNGCTGASVGYTLTITCQTISVTNPANANGTVNAGFSEQFTQSGAIGGATFSTAGPLPAGLSLSTSGLLSGTPTQPGLFPITVTVTDGNGCTGTGTTYNLNISCQVITVTNPTSNSDPAGTPLVAANFTFTQSGAIGGATFTTASILPTGVTLTAAGVLTGTPTQGGSFPIVVTVTDANGCTGTNDPPTPYTLTITCPVITVTNPVNFQGTAGTAFSEQFTQSGGQGTITWSEVGTLPTGFSFNTSTGVLSGTTTQIGAFPITVTATDQNGCTGSGAQYNLQITCQTVTVTNPGVNTGTVDAAFSQTFTATGILGTVAWSETGALPAGITLNAASGVLSGTPTVKGSFPIVVTATDTNGCFGTSNYTLTINCQTITVTNPATNSGTVDAPFSQTFTQTGGHGTTTFSTASPLPPGMTLDPNTGVLSGTPTAPGTYPIVVVATDANGCTGTSPTFTLTVNCQTITVTNPVVNTGTTGTFFSQTFTQTGGHGTTTFSTSSTLPTGFSLSSGGVLSGTTNQHTSFSIVVVATDANGCTGTGATYTLTINCQTITVTNPANASGTVSAAFSEQFTETGGIGGGTFTTGSPLPTGLSLSTGGLLSGTPTQSGSFPIVVTYTDGNGCSGSGATYTLVIACQTITVTNPVNNTGTAGTAFSAQFTQSGAVGTVTWSESGALPAGITFNTSTGLLSGTTNAVGPFSITVTATDANTCQGTGSAYNFTINCQTISITNPTLNSVQSGTSLTPASSWTFTATGILGTANWTVTSGTLPTGITLNAGTGVLSGSSTQQGTYPLTVTVTDTNGCSANSPYTLTVTCPVITPARTGGGSFPAGTVGTAYAGQSFTASGGVAPYTFAVTSGTFPTGLTLSSAGAIGNTPTATGTFVFTVTATDVNGCTGAASFSIAINPAATGDSYSNLVNNTEAVVTGGTTASPATPFVSLTGTIIANDLPSGGVAVTAGTFATTQGGSVTIAADGTFKYTPPVTVNALATDTFTYTITSNTGGTATPTQATGTVTLNLAGRVWYVDNSQASNGNGQSQSPFNTTSGTLNGNAGGFTNAARTGPDKAGDIIYIYNGTGTTTNMASGIKLLANEQLIGQGVALVVNTVTLVPAGTKPQITNTAGDGVTLNNGNTVKGLNVTGTSSNGISGTTTAGLTMDTMTIQGAGAASSGLVLTTPSGTVTITNTTISNSPFALTINGGTAAFTMNNTNTLSSNAGQRTINFSNLGATSVTNIGAAITDNGIGISVTNSVSGAQVSFTGTQTLGTTTNAAVTLTTNTGAILSFSGTLGITTSTGSGFVASAGGTLNVSGTANITTGAAGAALSLNGMTVGGSGVTFNSVTGTGVTTGIGLVNVAGLVTVNGGTISNAGTGVALQGASTSLTLANFTINGTTTTGITNTTNFGTLTIGASVNVSAATALNLTTGAVSGTFANVSSTGGTNGVNLNAVTGTWGATAGTLTGATGSTFNVTGGSGGTISWGPAITQANGANVVTIAGANSNTINFTGNVQTTGTSTGISISASSGSYSFTGATSTIAGTGGGILIFNESGSVSFGAGFNISAATTSFKIGGTATATTANITYSGTITNNNNGGVLLDINSNPALGTYSTGTITFNGTSLSGNVNGNAGVRSVINNMTGTLVVNHLSLTSSNIGFANTLVAIGGTNTAGSFTFNNLVLSATGTNHTGKGLTMTGGGTLTITATGGASSIDVSSTALDLNGVALGASTLATVSSSGGANGVLFTSCTGGTFTMSGGALSGNSGSTFKVLNGTASITYNGTMAQPNAAKIVDVSGITGGTIALGGAITGSGSCTGVSVAGSASTVNITGGMTLDGTSDVFSATAGITLNVTGINTVGATTAPTGPAVNITATIGASNVTFRSVSATGGANGIVLSGTGANTFTVTGNAGTCTSLASTCTGGTIQNTTSHAVSLTSTTSPSLNFMKITNIGRSGVFGTTVTNFTLTNSVIDGVNTTHTGADANVAFNTGVAGTENNVSGTVSITNNKLNNSYQAGVDIQNYSGTISSLTITGNALTSNTSNTLSLGTAINVVANRGAGNHANISAGSISGNTILNFPSGAGIQVIGGNSNSGQAVTIASVGSPLAINGNTITGAGTGSAGIGTNGIAVTAGESTTAYFNIGASGAANNITNVRGDGIDCSLFGNGTEKCIIANNIINANNTAGSSGINTGADQSVASGSAGAGTLYLDIHNNNVSNTTGVGILATVSSVSTTGIYWIQNNTVAAPTTASGTIYGIRVSSGNGVGNPTVCLKLSGNTTAGSTNGGTTAPGIGIRQSHTDPGGGIGTFNIDGLPNNPSTDAQMEAYLGNAGQNPGSANGTFGATGVAAISGGGTYHPSTCSIP